MATLLAFNFLSTSQVVHIADNWFLKPESVLENRIQAPHDSGLGDGHNAAEVPVQADWPFAESLKT
jgi:hypothetical protein